MDSNANPVKIHRMGGGVFTLEGFLSSGECGHLIQESERRGYAEAAIKTDDGDRLFKEARNNDRIIFDDAPLALRFFERARPFLPPEIDGWVLDGFNERWRYYRYGVDQKFAWHQDGTVRTGPQRETFLTFMMYLNDDFEGGSTDFGWESVRPSQGTALAFPHRLRHQGAPVTAGVKYVLRTDVFYVDAKPGFAGA